MKRLTLVRHAKSSWKDAELADFDRPLNKRGEGDAPRMGERLARRGLQPELLLSSPARRARQTAEAIAAALRVDSAALRFSPAIYEASPAALLELIRGCEERWQHLLLVGHNPGLTELGNLLAGCGIDNLPTCAVLVIDFEISNWRQVAPGAGALFLYDYPKNPAEIPSRKKPSRA